MFKNIVFNRFIFHSIHIEKSIKSISSFYLDIQMKKLNDQNQFNKSLLLFNEYKNKFHKIPSSISLTLALKACQKLGDFKRGHQIIKEYSSRLNFNDYHLLTSIIHLLIQSGDVDNAQRIFDQSSHKSMGMYGAIIQGLVKNNLCEKAIDLFFKIKNPNERIIVFFLNACAKLADQHSLNLAKEVLNQIDSKYKTNEFILCTASNMFLKCNQIKSAEDYLSKMSKSDIKYRMLMKISNLKNEPDKAFDLYNQMIIDGFKANQMTYLLLINASAQIGMENICHKTVKKIPDNLLQNLTIQNALIDMWGKAGLITESERIFKTLIQPDIISLTAMINSYCLNGMGFEAVELFSQISLKMLNERTYICVLNACSHSGLVDQAKKIFANIPNKTEFIFTTMVDCFSRSFLWNEAQTTINQYEHLHCPSLPMYMSFLSGARNQRNSSLSEQIYNRIEKIFPNYKKELIPAAILLANTYQSSGNLEKARDIKNKLNVEGAKKHQGLSWTEVNGKIFKFSAHDRSHPQTLMIYSELDRIQNELIQHGYQFDLSSNTRILMNDENIESILCGHSEKLAIAFNFIQQPRPTIIQITKNLRICQDCHQSTKMICRIRQCSIRIRDATRIHHFSPDGTCSCQEHF